MAKSDLTKFRELLNTDTEFQDKIRKAAEEYTGEQDAKAVFENLLVPLGEEYGLSATYEEFSEFIGSFAETAEGELSEDELSQVAGGKGFGETGCLAVGVGFGGGGAGTDCGACFAIGLGEGHWRCRGEGQ